MIEVNDLLSEGDRTLVDIIGDVRRAATKARDAGDLKVELKCLEMEEKYLAKHLAQCEERMLFLRESSQGDTGTTTGNEAGRSVTPPGVASDISSTSDEAVAAFLEALHQGKSWQPDRGTSG